MYYCLEIISLRNQRCFLMFKIYPGSEDRDYGAVKYCFGLGFVAAGCCDRDFYVQNVLFNIVKIIYMGLCLQRIKV